MLHSARLGSCAELRCHKNSCKYGDGSLGWVMQRVTATTTQPRCCSGLWQQALQQTGVQKELPTRGWPHAGGQDDPAADHNEAVAWLVAAAAAQSRELGKLGWHPGAEVYETHPGQAMDDDRCGNGLQHRQHGISDQHGAMTTDSDVE